MQPAVTEALTRALFSEWAAKGYGALSLENVARSAGVGKAALYRRWPSKLAMVTDRLEEIGVALAATSDTGSLAGDVTTLLTAIRRILRHPLVHKILPDLHAEMLRSPPLAAAIRARLQRIRRERAIEVLRRAIARGELDDGVDLELACDVIAALPYWRIIVTGARADQAYLDTATRFIVAGLEAL